MLQMPATSVWSGQWRRPLAFFGNFSKQWFAFAGLWCPVLYLLFTSVRCRDIEGLITRIRLQWGQPWEDFFQPEIPNVCSSFMQKSPGRWPMWLLEISNLSPVIQFNPCKLAMCNRYDSWVWFQRRNGPSGLCKCCFKGGWLTVFSRHRVQQTGWKLVTYQLGYKRPLC